MTMQHPDTRQQAILQAASKAFATYGFRKTSMNDIALGAGMSRPAVYLHYRNKEAIFRSLVQAYYDTAATAVAQALNTPGDAAEVLAAAFMAQVGEMMEAMLNSPHGMELLDAGAATASDIKETGEARLTALYADWLRDQAGRGTIQLTQSAERVAATITAALKGIKTDGSDIDTIKSRIGVLSNLIGRGLIR